MGSRDMDLPLLQPLQASLLEAEAETISMPLIRSTMLDSRLVAGSQPASTSRFLGGFVLGENDQFRRLPSGRAS